MRLLKRMENDCVQVELTENELKSILLGLGMGEIYLKEQNEEWATNEREEVLDVMHNLDRVQTNREPLPKEKIALGREGLL